MALGVRASQRHLRERHFQSGIPSDPGSHQDLHNTGRTSPTFPVFAWSQDVAYCRFLSRTARFPADAEESTLPIPSNLG